MREPTAKTTLFTLSLLLGLLITACDSSADTVTPNPAQDDLAQDMVFTSQYPEGQTTTLEFDSFDEPAEVVIKGDNVFLGDILVGEVKGDSLAMADGQTLAYSDDGLVTQGTGILSSSGQKWPNGVIPYEFDGGLSQELRNRFLMAKADYDAKTAVRFVQRTNQSNYVRVIDDGGCYSYIGRIGGAQSLSLGSGCDANAARHEMGHALGLQHEQVRRDRDQWVQVNVGGSNNAIDNGSAGNPIGSYDFQSMMHYRNYYRDGRWDYEPKTGFPPERVGNDEVNTFTSGDLAAIASIYGGSDGGADATVCFFYDINYGGRQLCVRGTGTLGVIASDWNDQASSVKVTPGYVVEMYYDSDLRGGGISTGGNLSDLRDHGNPDFNDKMSSLRIRRK